MNVLGLWFSSEAEKKTKKCIIAILIFSILRRILFINSDVAGSRERKTKWRVVFDFTIHLFWWDEESSIE